MRKLQEAISIEFNSWNEVVRYLRQMKARRIKRIRNGYKGECWTDGVFYPFIVLKKGRGFVFKIFGEACNEC